MALTPQQRRERSARKAAALLEAAAYALRRHAAACAECGDDVSANNDHHALASQCSFTAGQLYLAYGADTSPPPSFN